MARKISELFFELRARTEGLQKDLDTSQRQLGKWADFVKANPVGTAAALGAAMLGIGLKAIAAAEETDKAVRQMTANLPKGTASAQQLRDAISDVAIEAGVAKSAVIDAAKEIARLGVSSADELKQRLQGVQLLTDATGVATSTAVQGLDQVMDLFGLDANQAVATLAKLAQAARGRVDIDSLFGAFQAAAPRVRELGLSVDDTTKAIVRLLDEGKNSKQVAKFLNEHDAADIREFAKSVHLGADAMQELNERAAEVRRDADHTSQAIKNKLGEAFEDLGRRLTPARDKLYEILAGLVQIAAHGSLKDILTAGVGASETLVLGASPSAAIGAFRRGVANAAAPPTLTIEHTAPTEDQLRGFPGAPHGGGGSDALLTVDEKKKLADDLAFARKALADFAQSTTQILAGGTKSAVDNALAELDQFTDKFVAAREEIEKKIAALPAKSGADATRAALQATLGQLGGDFAKGIAVRRKAIDDLATHEADTLRATISKELGELTGTLAEHGAAAIAEQGKAIREQIDTASKLSGVEKERLKNEQGIVELLQQQKNIAADATRDVPRLIETVDVAGPTNGSFTAINSKSLELQAKLRELTAGLTKDVADQVKQGDGYRAIQEAILKLDKERAELLQKLLGIQKDGVETAKDQLQHIADQARATRDAVDGALQLAGAFGLVDEKTVNALRNIGEIATQIPVLTSQLSKLGEVGKDGKPLATLGSVAGAALPILGGIASLVSLINAPSPAEQERLRVLAANTQALKDLTTLARSGGLLGKSGLGEVGGSVAAAARDAIEGLYQRAAKAGEQLYSFSKIDLTKLLDPKQLAAVEAAAKAAGITLDGTVGSLDALREALSKGIPLLGKFGHDVADMFAELDAESKILGKSSPLDNLAGILEKLGAKSAGIASIFDGIDTSDGLTPDEIAKIRQRVQDLFKLMESEKGLSVEQLGDLNGEQFLQLLEQIIGDLDQLTQSAADKLKGTLAAVDQQLELEDKTSPLDRFQAHAEQYKALGGALGDFLGQFDLTSTDGIAQMDAALADFLAKVKENPDSFDLAGLSIDEFIAALLDLDQSADSVAATIETAAQKIADAEELLNTSDAILGTSPTEKAQERGNLYGFNLGDLSTQAGVDAAVENLRAVFKSLDPSAADFKEKSREILETIQALQAITFDGGAAAAAPSAVRAPSGSGETEAVTNTARALTEVTGNRLADYAHTTAARVGTLIGLEQNELDLQSKMLAALLRPVITGPILPPIVPTAFGQPSQSSTQSTSSAPAGGTVFNIRTYITLELSHDDLFNAQAAQAAKKLGREAAEEFNKYLNDRLRDEQRRAGDTSVA